MPLLYHPQQAMRVVVGCVYAYLWQLVLQVEGQMSRPCRLLYKPVLGRCCCLNGLCMHVCVHLCWSCVMGWCAVSILGLVLRQDRDQAVGNWEKLLFSG
jgi:hypothetical protein